MSRQTGIDEARVISQMQAYRDTLMMERTAIDHRIAGIETAMGAMDSGAITTRRRGVGARRVGRAGKGGGRRGPGRPEGRKGSLKQMIVKVLRQRSQPLSPSEIALGVKRAGYKTRSRHLTKSVSNTLPDLSGVRKVGRGLYQA